MSPTRVSGMPMTASAAITRRSQASASSIAPPMQPPWMEAIVGLVISSARFHASRHSRRKARSIVSCPGSSASVFQSMPAENIAPLPRTTTQ